MSMHTYVIERELPGAGELTEAELHTIATKSNAVIADMNAEAAGPVGPELRHRRQDLLHLPGGGRRVAARPRRLRRLPGQRGVGGQELLRPDHGD